MKQRRGRGNKWIFVAAAATALTIDDVAAAFTRHNHRTNFITTSTTTTTTTTTRLYAAEDNNNNNNNNDNDEVVVKPIVEGSAAGDENKPEEGPVLITTNIAEKMAELRGKLDIGSIASEAGYLAAARQRAEEYHRQKAERIARGEITQDEPHEFVIPAEVQAAMRGELDLSSNDDDSNKNSKEAKTLGDKDSGLLTFSDDDGDDDSLLIF